MQFKYPEILFALFLLLIPIFIHLFQLRRFQRIEFTNVAFLKKVTIQTRKSSEIKKWLTLLMRLLALACIIIAFAQPFIASDTALSDKKETVIYIDNSFSMQAKGNKGSLLERSLQDLFDKGDEIGKLSWFSNNSERINSSPQDFKNDILAVGYSSNQLTPAEVLLKANQLFSQEKNVSKQLVFISDFQQVEAFPDISTDFVVDVVQLRPVKATNISIDTAFIASKNASTTQLKVSISKQGDVSSDVPVSLFENGKLKAKTAVDLSQNSRGTITFDIDASESFIGKLELSESNMPFDNSLFFSINKPEKIKVLAINGSDGNFLQRLFEKERFDFEQQTGKTLDYNQIPNQNFIVLNALDEIPSSLVTALKSFSDAGGSLLIIPSTEADLNSYNSLISALSMGTFSEKISQEKKITKIVFAHPLFQGVFEKEITNFQYPKVNSINDIKTTATTALAFEDMRPFLVEKGKTYLFTAAIDRVNSNFLNSPLVVPTVYNMGLQSLPLPDLYYTIGKQNTIAVQLSLGPDQILAMKDSISRFIPLQQTKSNHVLITTTEEPNKAGNYQLIKDTEVLQTISYNYSRRESRMNYLDAADWEGVKVYKSVDNLFESLSQANSINSFWKWFAIFALFFLLCEMFILKFWK
ncbi:hypothetical protein EI546_04075 [Aequorivita sp. H23M31]|uniref:Aerotolerance regulator N-terminal domain-containing protein n=1 Tax=Aequorivita ciconiae TaxID=2494375 RepID=A0A410G104_9FLAO|nr:BatA domain-containing protein [Aequorivita sp. H23M31]QAA80954.1 hypothetical protein EI546_04075 [Aequorivita sp. H23M31]